MCGLCGMLAGPAHWTKSASTPAAFASRVEPYTRARERQARTRLVNAVLRHYGLSLTDWAGSGYVLSNRTGRHEIVSNLAELWGAADRMLARSCDPLDDALIASLGDANG